MNTDFRKTVLGCIKICDNPFVRSDPSSTDLTLSAVDTLCGMYAVDDILAILQPELYTPGQVPTLRFSEVFYG